MAYNNVISRADAAGTIPVEYSNELLNGVAQDSFLMRMGRRLRNMTVYEEKLPVLSALATAYFPSGEIGLVQTSEINWEDVTIYAEDLAVVVPVSKNVLNDAKIPIWDEVKKELITAGGVAIDNAQLYGTNKPAPGRLRSSPRRDRRATMYRWRLIPICTKPCWAKHRRQ